MDKRMLPYAMIFLAMAIIGVAIVIVGLINNSGLKLIEIGKYIVCGGTVLYVVAEIIGVDDGEK